MEKIPEQKIITVLINGRTIVCRAEQTVLDVCQAADIFVPTLCNDRRLVPQGSCRLCIVTVKGYAMPVAACSTPVVEGMEIATETDELTRLRRETLTLILANHPNDCMCCEKAGRCTLQELAFRYQVAPPSGVPAWNALERQEDNPFIVIDPNKCVRCGRCISICRDIVLRDAIVMRTPDGMDETRLMPEGRIVLLKERCTFCGQCVSTCPVGAILERPSLGKGRAQDVAAVQTVCSYCGTGCSMNLHVRDGQVIRVTSDVLTPANNGNLCIKGKFGSSFINHPDRLTTPLIREGDTFRPASWDEALDLVATRFMEIKAAHGTQSVGAFSSSRCTNEENYLLAKWARAVLGTNNIDNIARV